MEQNQSTDSPQFRLLEAKQWLVKNPSESQAIAARLFKINRSSLVASIRRDKHSKRPRRGQNRILSPIQEQVIHNFIRSYLENRQLPTKDIIFGAICNLRKAHELTLPSKNWFRKCFKIGYPKEVQVLIPTEMQELYSLSLENRRSITIIKTITANGITPIPLAIIVKGKYHMDSWYRPRGLTCKELVLLSENDYTSDMLGICFMEHFIKYTQEKERKAAEKEANKEARMLCQLANKEKKEQKAAWVVWRKKESLRKKAIKQLPRGIMGAPELYKEHTPPPFIELGKDPVDQKPSVTPTVDSTELPLYRPPQTPVRNLFRTSFARPEPKEEEQEQEQQQRQADESEEEDFIRLDLEGEFGYSNSSSESECSLNSSVSDKEDYYVL
ncbi:hypothetical protein B7463_g9251, partial [Scytalidium lignicola]